MMLRRERIGRPGSAVTAVLAGLALVVALGSLFLTVFRDPFGPVTQMNWKPTGTGLEGYDFSTPAGAYKGRLEIEQKHDIRAVMELQRQLEEKELKEKIDTLEVKKEADLQLPGKGEAALNAKDDKDAKKREIKVLFITFLRDGKRQHKVEFMEKHADSGLWKPTYVGQRMVKGVDPKLAEEVQKWELQDDKKSKKDT